MTDTAGAPDVVELLETDHARIHDLIAAGDRWAVVRELSSHLVAEDQLVYPALRRAVNDVDELIDACLDGDHELEEALLAVDKEEVADLDAVAALFSAHVQAIETEVFPRMRATIDNERLVALGDSLQEVVRSAPTHPHPHNPDEGAFEVVADAIAAEIDQIRDAYHEGKGDR